MKEFYPYFWINSFLRTQVQTAGGGTIILPGNIFHALTFSVGLEAYISAQPAPESGISYPHW